MDAIKIVEIKEDIRSRNNVGAGEIRDALSKKGVYYLNVMASPGSGKTTLLVRVVNALKERYRIGVIEADIDSAVDAETIAEETGVKTIQVHTGGACHMTYQMSQEALGALELNDLDAVILENIGNLVCPAEFDTGATQNLVLWSVPEGDDKPKKYPLMFEVASVVAVTKTDVSPAFDFSRRTAVENIRRRNADAPVFFTSAATGDGIDELVEYIAAQIEAVKTGLKKK